MGISERSGGGSRSGCSRHNAPWRMRSQGSSHLAHSRLSRERLALRSSDELPLAELLTRLWPHKSARAWEKQAQVARSAVCATTYATGEAELLPLVQALNLERFVEVVLPCAGTKDFVHSVRKLLPGVARVVAFDRKDLATALAFQADLFQPSSWTSRLHAVAGPKLLAFSPPWEAVEPFLAVALLCCERHTVAVHVRTSASFRP